MSAAHADDYADVNRLIKAGQTGEAMAKVVQYLASKPRDPQMRFIKGVILAETGKPAEAISVFTKITEDHPELPEPYNNLAVLYAGQKQFDKARAALEMAIRTNPSYATAHENLGDIYAKLASQAYSKALLLDGNNAGVPSKLALIRNLFNVDSIGQKSAATKPTVAAPAPVAPRAPVAASAPSAPSAPSVASVASVASTAVRPVAPTALAVAAPPPAPIAPPAAASAAENEVAAAVDAWAEAWAAKDVNTYLAAYGKEFATPGNQARKAWEEDRRARIVGKSHIVLKLSKLSIDVNGNKASVRFKQDYSADSLNVSNRKTLNLAKVGERWLIVRETTGG
ncbi:MAG: tetratricopeptide repeat protein [Pseudomonas sp.]|nr:tetratricopeptide repeat protein [Pseudomonas sp.]